MSYSGVPNKPSGGANNYSGVPNKPSGSPNNHSGSPNTPSGGANNYSGAGGGGGGGNSFDKKYPEANPSDYVKNTLNDESNGYGIELTSSFTNNSDYNSRLSDLVNFQPNLETAEAKLDLGIFKDGYETLKGYLKEGTSKLTGGLISTDGNETKFSDGKSSVTINKEQGTVKGAVGIDTGASLKDKGVKAEAYLKTNAPNAQETKTLTTTIGAEASVKKGEYKQKVGVSGNVTADFNEITDTGKTTIKVSGDVSVGSNNIGTTFFQKVIGLTGADKMMDAWTKTNEEQGIEVYDNINKK